MAATHRRPVNNPFANRGGGAGPSAPRRTVGNQDPRYGNGGNTHGNHQNRGRKGILSVHYCVVS
jgi:hypothetical protein